MEAIYKAINPEFQVTNDRAKLTTPYAQVNSCIQPDGQIYMSVGATHSIEPYKYSIRRFPQDKINEAKIWLEATLECHVHIDALAVKARTIRKLLMPQEMIDLGKKLIELGFQEGGCEYDEFIVYYCDATDISIEFDPAKRTVKYRYDINHDITEDEVPLSQVDKIIAEVSNRVPGIKERAEIKALKEKLRKIIE